MKIVFSVILIIVAAASQAQSDQLAAAAVFQAKGYYMEAIETYQRASTSNKVSSDQLKTLYKELGRCYFETHNYQKAEI